jgi:hypothetical protein
VTTALCYFTTKPPYDSAELRQSVVDEIASTFGLSFSVRALNGEPGVPIAMLTSDAQRQKLYAIWERFLERLRVSE